MKGVIFLAIVWAAVCGSVSAQIKIERDFDSGNIGEYKITSSGWIHMLPQDSVQVISLTAHTRVDPVNAKLNSEYPSSRWFHFRMQGVKDKMFFITIPNTEVVRPFYSYDGMEYVRLDSAENIYPQTINKLFTRDTVYLAYNMPYTYTRNEMKMQEWAHSPFVQRETIGYSVAGRQIEMMTVTDFSVPDENKKRIWIHSRVHTSETSASWHLESLIDELLSDSMLSAELRRNAIFYIVPQTNPDGVVGGYSRSMPSGVNLELNWDRPDSMTAPEVQALKKAMSRITAERPFDLVLNLHSQISPTITYWVHTPESTSTAMYRRKMMLSALTAAHSPYYGSEDVNFSKINPKYPEGWVWDNFGENTIAVTFETPYTYFRNDPSGDWVSPESLARLAHSSLLTISDLLDAGGEERIMVDSESMQVKGAWLKDSGEGELFFGNSYLVAEKPNASLSVVFNDVPKGEYEIYVWVVGDLGKGYPAGENEWRKVGEVTQKRNGRFVWRYKAAQQGDKLDAVLLVRKR